MAGAFPALIDACGIDFGTSNSTAGCGSAGPGQVALLPLEDGKVTLPSVVFFTPKTGASVTAAPRWPTTWRVTKGV